MTDVDPFLIEIPRAISKMPEDWTQDDVREMVVTFEYLWKFLHDLWLRTGGANDDIGSAIGVIAGDPVNIRLYFA